MAEDLAGVVFTHSKETKGQAKSQHSLSRHGQRDDHELWGGGRGEGNRKEVFWALDKHDEEVG